MMRALSETELLAPGGSLSQAVHALRAGASAVYAGAHRFSARSHAGNLDSAQFARLCGEAKRLQAAVYVAINTILTDDELGPALDLAWELWASGVTACIVQDIGLLFALQKYGPPLALHASTQMAVHSVSGARTLADWGVRRVVLARELSLAEIAAIHQAVPQLELEVFIHGSLCYAVSGLCLASGLVLQRSGNRGDCGQVCRTWSTLNRPGTSDPAGSWFSMNDLDATGQLRALGQAGVVAFKIEGRMKSPEWTAEIVAHYRALLDGLDPGEHREQARQAFGRNPTPGWLADPKGNQLVNHEFAGSMGRLVGRIEEIRNGQALVLLGCPLAVSDGIMIVRVGTPPKPWAAGVRGLFASATRGLARMWEAPVGSRVWIQAEADGQVFLPGDKGLDLRKVADHAANLALVKPESLPRYRHGLETMVNLNIEDGSIYKLQFEVPVLDGLSFSCAVQPEAARGAGSLADSLAGILGIGGESGFVANPIASNASLEGWYLSPAVLKEIRRAWHGEVARGFANLRTSRAESLVREASESRVVNLQVDKLAGQVAVSVHPKNLPPRSELSPRGDLPFVVRFGDLKPADLALWQGRLVLPLAPVWFDDTQGYADLRAWIAGLAEIEPKPLLVLGLGNVAQIDWYHRIGADPITAPFLGGAFADYGLYAANAMSQLALKQSIPGLTVIVPWIESDADRLEPAFNPPLFISRACFHRESLGRGCPGNGLDCPKSWDYQVQQGKRTLYIRVRDCISYTF